jgi:glutamate racemase
LTKKPNPGALGPIGIFDSGVGGLTVAKAVRETLPGEDIIYFGDTAHLPYGDKSADSIRYYSLKISKFLIQKGCKMIIIACNTASSAAYDLLLDFFDSKLLFVNVVDPLVESVRESNFSNVGVIATKATIHSNIYKNKIKAANQKTMVQQLATPLLVPMIEEGFHKGDITHSIIKNYLGQENMKNIDALLLACTHYPLIKAEIEEFYQHKIPIMDSTDVTANAAKNLLIKEDLLNPKESGTDQFFVSDYTEGFEQTAKMFYNQSVKLATEHIW